MTGDDGVVGLSISAVVILDGGIEVGDALSRFVGDLDPDPRIDML